MGSLNDSINSDTSMTTVQRSGSNFISQFNRRLASTELIERNSALSDLVQFLTDNHDIFIERENMLLVWKGIFYCFWLADKPLYQQEIADNLANKTLLLSTDLALVYLECFWITLAKEWFGVDRHRIDKYLLLQRRFVNAAFQILIKDNFQSNTLFEFHRIYLEGPLNPSSIKVADSIRYHILDVYLTELNKALPFESTVYSLVSLLEPVKNILSLTSNKAVFKRAQEAVFGPLISEMKASPQYDVFQVSAFPLAQSWFTLGANPSTSGRVRRFSYELVESLSNIFDLHSKDFLSLIIPSLSNNSSTPTSPKPSEIKQIPSPKNGTSKQSEVIHTQKKPLESELPTEVDSSDNNEDSSSHVSNDSTLTLPEEESSVPAENSIHSEDSYDEYSGFRSSSLDPLPKVSNGENISTHSVYVEDIFDPSLPPDKKKVRWVLERNSVKSFLKNNAMSPRATDAEIHSESITPSKGLLKKSPIPIRLNHKALNKSELGVPRLLSSSPFKSNKRKNKK